MLLLFFSDSSFILFRSSSDSAALLVDGCCFRLRLFLRYLAAREPNLWISFCNSGSLPLMSIETRPAVEEIEKAAAWERLAVVRLTSLKACLKKRHSNSTIPRAHYKAKSEENFRHSSKYPPSEEHPLYLGASGTHTKCHNKHKFIC